VTLKEIRQLFADAECIRLYAKRLAKNDNSKQQVYFGSGFEAVNIFPNKGVKADRSEAAWPKFKAKVDFGWLTRRGIVTKAPGAQLILYPQYPEVRFSGFLRGCYDPPSGLMRKRQPGRVLFLGLTREEKILGFVVGPRSTAAQQFLRLPNQATNGVFAILEIPNALSESKARALLLNELKKISRKGWIRSKQLGSDGRIEPCNGTRCGGYTLEAELGIAKNSKSEPDFHGWEVKQYGVSSFERLESGKITLMTPEPTGGYYHEYRPVAFVYKFGKPDEKGREGRHNFTGVHRCEVRNSATKLTLQLYGYDRATNRITRVEGAIRLVDDKGFVAASWSFSRLMSHWKRKHTSAVYVPSICTRLLNRRYRYGNIVRIATKTDFLLFLKALADQLVCYDPGIKVEMRSGKPVAKVRSQFRVSSRDIVSLYNRVETVTL